MDATEFLAMVGMEEDPDGTTHQVAVIMTGERYRKAGLIDSKHPDVEGRLYDNLCKNRKHKLRDEVRRMAKEIAMQVSDKKFEASVSWLDEFSRRFSISNKRLGILRSKGASNKSPSKRKSSVANVIDIEDTIKICSIQHTEELNEKNKTTTKRHSNKSFRNVNGKNTCEDDLNALEDPQEDSLKINSDEAEKVKSIKLTKAMNTWQAIVLGNPKQKEKPIKLTKAMTSLLKFTMSYDHFPSSLSMINLAKVMNCPWSQVKSWFSTKRLEKRKSGIHLHNTLLRFCPYCDNKLPFISKELGQEHLFELDHVKKVLEVEEKNAENCPDENKDITTIDNGNKDATNIDNVVMKAVKALGFNSAENGFDQNKTTSTIDNVVMKTLGFNSVESEPVVDKMNMNMDCAIRKALGFNSVSVSELPSTSKENVGNSVLRKALGFNSVSELTITSQENIGIVGNVSNNRVKNVSPASSRIKKRVDLPTPEECILLVKNVSPASSRIKRRGDLPTPEECILLLKPLQQGWLRKVIYRANSQKISRQWDVYYTPPGGKQLRSMVKIGDYLEQNGIQDLTMENFSYTYHCLGENVPNEVIRHAEAKVIKPLVQEISSVSTGTKPSVRKISSMSTGTKPLVQKPSSVSTGTYPMVQELPPLSGANQQKIINGILSKPKSKVRTKLKTVAQPVYLIKEKAALESNISPISVKAAYERFISQITSQVSTSSADSGLNTRIKIVPWHTPSLDNENDQDQKSPFETNENFELSLSLHQEIPFPVTDTQTQISKRTSDIPLIKIKCMSDLQDHSEQATDTENIPLLFKKLSSMFKFDNKHNTQTVSDLQSINAKNDLVSITDIAETTGIGFYSESGECPTISPMDFLSVSMNNEDKSLIKNDSDINLKDTPIEEVIDKSSTISTNVVAFNSLELSSDECNLNKNGVQSNSDIHKEINVRRSKRKKSNDDLPVSKIVKVIKEISQTSTDEITTFKAKNNTTISYEYALTIDSDMNKKSNTIGQTFLEDQVISESPSHGKRKLKSLRLKSVRNSEIVKNNTIKAGNELIDDVEILSNNDDIPIISDEIIELSDIEDEGSDPLCNPTIISPCPNSISSHSRLPSLHL